MSLKKFFSVFSIALVFVLGGSTAEAAYPLGSEVVFYHFEDIATGTTTDGTTGTTTNSGSGGVAYDGLLVGNASTTASFKRFGSRGAAFGESLDWMKTYFGSSTNPTTNSVSASMWVNKGGNDCTANDDHIFGVGSASGRFYIRCKNSTTNKWDYRIQTNLDVYSPTILSSGWEHIVLVASSTDDKAVMYVNGVAVAAPAAFTSFQFPGEFFVGNYNDTTATLDRTQGGGAYMDEVAIYQTALVQSDVTALYKAGDGVAPVISAIATSSLSDTGVTISWTTDENASTQIEYGTTASYGSATTEIDNTTFITAHSQSITGLSPGTTYHYRVVSKDPMGTTASSTDATFTTTGSGAPTITNVTSTKANGYYGAGNIIDINLTFSEAVTATTSVTVTLETGTTDRTCTFTVSNSTSASCNYTVQTGDISSDLTVSSVSGYIESQTAVPMVSFSPATNLAANKNLIIGEYISFVSPTPSANSTSTASTITAYASSTMLTATSSTWYLTLESPGGSVVSTVSTTTRYGDYNLTHLTNVISGSDLSALTANASGIAFVASSTSAGSIYVVHNSSNVISEISLTGSVLRTITCSSCGDMEGITLVSSVASTTAPGVNDLTFMISTEDTITNLAIFRVVIPSKGSATVNATNSFSTGISTASTNLGLEGIAYDSSRDLYFLAREKVPALFQYTSAGATSTVCSNLNFTAIATDFSDLAYVNSTKTLYVLSDENSRVIPVDVTSTSTCAFVDSDGDGNTTNDTGDYLNNIPYSIGGTTDDQSEGVTWDENGDYFYVIGEDHDFSRYRTNAYTVRHTFTGLSAGSYILKASTTDATTGLTAFSPDRAIGLQAGDVTAPTITSVSSDKANGSYSVGQVIDIDVTFSENVTSTGSVTVTLETGTTDRTCTFSVSNASTGTCNYTVQAEDSSSDLTVNSISGTIADQSANSMSNFVPATNLAANKALVIDTGVPQITSIATSSLSSTGITVTWTTNEAATSTVEYGTTASYGTASTSATATTSHSITLTGLSPATLYHFRVSSGDAAFNYATSSDSTFTTSAGADVTPPSVSVTAPSAGTISGTVSLAATASDNVSVAGVTFYIDGVIIGTEDTTSAYTGSLDSTSKSDGSHTIVAVARDTSNNYATSTGVSVTIDNADSTPPSITNIASSTTATRATITWDTNESATSTVFYGTTSSYGTASTSSTFVTTGHSITLSGLANSTLYHFQVSSGDASNNYATSSDLTFRTTADTGAPQISNVEITPSNTSITFTWDTDELASSMVVYGPSSSLGATTTEADTSPRVLSHSVTVSDLLACTRYFFRLASTDAVSNIGYDTDSVVSTTGCTGSADIESSEVEDVTVSTGADLSLSSGDQQIDVEVPPNATATSSALVFQIKIINDDSVIGSIDSPSGTALVNGQMYDLKAYINATTTLDTFNEPITITLTYSDDDVDGIDESTLKIYRYDGSDWVELDDCDVDEDANTITCTTDHFSVFGLFGDEAETGSRSGGRRRSSSSNRTVAIATTPTATNPAITALLARIEELQRQLALLEQAEPLPTASSFIFTKALKFGDNNTDVLELQKALNSDPETVVALTGPGSKGNETTMFGYATKAAVIKFQLKHNVITTAADPFAGVVGPGTRAKLNLR